MNHQYNFLKRKFYQHSEIRFHRAYLAYVRYNKPISRSLQVREFFEDEFYIYNTLDCRPETEQLIELILYKIQYANNILDIGTGSGCILLTLLKKYKHARGIGTDICHKALETAKINAKQLNIGRRAKFIKTNWCSNIECKFDLIVSNPPYVESLINEELKYDPYIALKGNIETYKEIISMVMPLIHEKSYIFFEINETYGNKIRSILESYNLKSQIYKDYSGKDRFIMSSVSYVH